MRHRLATVLIAAAAVSAWPAAGFAQRASEPVTLNFVNADIEAVARTMAAITGRSIVVDPRVKGTISLATDRPVTPAQAYNQFLATLRLSGFTVVDAGGLLKVVPEAEAKLQGGTVTVGPGGAANSQIVTQIFRLNHENAGNLVPILRPLISPNNTINVNPGNNSLVITDYADNLQRLARIIAALDVSNATDVDVINLRHSLASDLAPVVQRLAEASGSSTIPGQPAAPVAGGDASYRTTVIAEPRSNSLIVRAANPARLALVRSLVERLDRPGGESAEGNIHVVYLKNAEATRLAAVLRAALASMATNTQGGIATGGGGITATPAAVANAGSSGSPATAPVAAAAQPSTGGQIQADPATNSLIITAPEPQYRQLRAVIDRLDARRAQVFVESLIAEVNADKVAEFGIQWQNAFGNENSRHIGVLGTNFSVGGQNIISLQAGAANGSALPSTGINAGVVRNIGGVYVLAALARFLESNADGNTLSTPTLLTLDNEEAKIVIGQNVPFVTGQYTNANVGTNGSVNPFQTIERKDVGITLRIKPQISENGTVRMTIFQEVSNVDPTSVNSPSGLITNKRSIESSVLIDDGAIVVLGGLLQDEFSNSQQKVPGVGDVPLFGNLFKAQSRSRKKTNLMVFLRPVVVRDGVSTNELSLDRYDLMRNLQQGTQPQPSVVTPVNAAPVLPAATQPARPAAAPAAAPGATTAPLVR